MMPKSQPKWPNAKLRIDPEVKPVLVERGARLIQCT